MSSNMAGRLVAAGHRVRQSGDAINAAMSAEEQAVIPWTR
jgi:hypothetical protein